MNPETFAEMHRKYRDRLLFSVTGMVRDRDSAEDITSTVFLLAYKRRDQFRGDSSFYTWVYAIAINQVLNWRHRQRRLRIQSLDTEQNPQIAAPGLLAEMLERTECCHRLRRTLIRLPRKIRGLLIQRFVRGHSVG